MVRFAVLLGLAALTATEPPKLDTFHGKVVPLAELLQKQGAELEPEAAPHFLALQTDDGKLYVLVKDAGSRLFFRDNALLNRPVQLRGRLVPGSGLLLVNQAHVLKDGQPHEVYYWCEKCAIKRYVLDAGGVCECCGGPMERREEKVK